MVGTSDDAEHEPVSAVAIHDPPVTFWKEMIFVRQPELAWLGLTLLAHTATVLTAGPAGP